MEEEILCAVGISRVPLVVNNDFAVRQVERAIACVRCLQAGQRTDD
jgi:hypothetical protein